MDNFFRVHNNLLTIFNSGRTLPEQWRRTRLDNLLRLLNENKDDIFEAIRLDTGKSSTEVFLTELGISIQQIEFLIKNLHSLLQTNHVRTPMMQRPSVSYTIYQPKGVVLISCPINYPLNYLFVPLAGALAAGNCVCIYSSGLSMMNNFTQLMKSLHLKYFDDDSIKWIFQGDEDPFSIYDQQWDQILYIGSASMSKQIISIASRHNTPVSCLNDVKCPVIVDKSCELPVSVKRILWGKMMNAGQNNASPDYVLVHHSILEDFLTECKKVLNEFYGEDPSTSPNFSKISDDINFRRLVEILDGSGNIAVGGRYNSSTRYFSPTIVTDVNLDSKLMRETISGPILPVIPFNMMEEAIQFIKERPKPTVLYLFANDKIVQDKVLLNTISGSCVINDVLIHLAIEELPYGGVGESGNVILNGKHTFRTFSHCKGVLHKATWMDPRLRYPPYEEGTKLQISQLLM